MDNKAKTKPQKLLEATITLCVALSLAAALLAWLAPWSFPFEMLAEFRRQFRILAAITIPLAFLINTKPIKKAALSITAIATVLLQTAALLPWDSPT